MLFKSLKKTAKLAVKISPNIIIQNVVAILFTLWLGCMPSRQYKLFNHHFQWSLETPDQFLFKDLIKRTCLLNTYDNNTSTFFHSPMLRSSCAWADLVDRTLYMISTYLVLQISVPTLVLSEVPTCRCWGQ